MIRHRPNVAKAVSSNRSYPIDKRREAGRCWLRTVGCIQCLRREDREPESDEIVVLVPGIRSPRKTKDIAKSLHVLLPTDLAERLTALRTRIEVMASAQDKHALPLKPKRKTATRSSGAIVADLQQAVEDYLPILRGLTDEGCLTERKLPHGAVFSWTNQEDILHETSISYSLYELLSVLHLAAILALFQANLLLTPKTPADGSRPKITDGQKYGLWDPCLQMEEELHNKLV